jgi:hypothetical protein
MIVRGVIVFIVVLIFTGCSYLASIDGQSTGVRHEKKSDHVLTLVADQVSDDLVLAVGGGNHSFILNKSGERLWSWEFNESLGNDLKLLPSAHVLGMFNYEESPIKFGGGYAGLTQIIDFNDTITWEFKYASKNFLSHHESVFLPNGDLLMLSWERVSEKEAHMHGVNMEGDIFPEKIIQIDTATKEIVWQWRSWDHIVQDHDATKLSYGDILENKELININYALRENGDIMHANGIFYDATRDVLFVSINHYSEVWVIDHQYNVAETAGELGDLLFRLGNPRAYKDTVASVFLDRTHTPNLIPEGYPGAGNLLLFNNGLKAKKSVVYEFDIPEKLTIEDIEKADLIWSFSDKNLSYGRISGAYRLSNGNTLICEGDYGFWEITDQKEIVWQYKDVSTTFWRGYPIDQSHKLFNLVSDITDN